MKNKDEIVLKIQETEKRLNIIEDNIKKQLAKKFFERDQDICLFMGVEKRVYSMLLQELKWVIGNE